ncbi:hypothetical protein PGTUg99_001624 [Puccinia graminis f. sp. tritici]|uniref:Zn(2)-C6 fungal-type domain-containing protein n=1 Tax=Puccinia graminis f. sp. tritici TaxID=56615 RepID=A0A5B0NK73_PUCGR|nr:hypothetical protein PGTUg99_001624 [Puccinia graminis f. sp. tritici]
MSHSNNSSDQAHHLNRQSLPTNPSSSSSSSAHETHDQDGCKNSHNKSSNQENNPLASPSQPPPIKPKKKLDRHLPTCSGCRKRRTRCDRGRPCSECDKRNMACDYSATVHYTSIAEQVDRDEYIERLEAEARLRAFEGPTTLK